jgi:hypothetical protein
VIGVRAGRRVLRGRSATDRKLAALAACELTAGWTQDELLWLGRVLEVVDLAAGEAVPGGGRVQWRYLVAEGTLAVERLDGEVRLVQAGFVDATRCRSLAALTDCRLFALPPQEAWHLREVAAAVRRRGG